MYIGLFENGLSEGMGAILFDQGAGRYIGDFEKGMYHGTGKYEFFTTPDTSMSYIGQWNFG